MKIEDIGDVINFRYDPKKYTNADWKYPENANRDVLLKCPKIFEYFDSVITKWGIIGNYALDFNSNKNKNILCCPEKLNCLVEKLKPDEKKNILIVAGTDLTLSRSIKLIEKITFNFNEIYYEAKDINVKKIKTIPMGLVLGCTLRNGGNDIILDVINRNNLPKKKLITTAFGSRFPHLNNCIKERKDLINFCEKNSWITKNMWNPIIYYDKLSEYKFFICPLGAGIQAPKIFECLLVETIPVCIKGPAFEDLKEYGFPILLINNFNELNETMLNYKYENEFKDVNWEKVKYNLTIEGFAKKFKLEKLEKKE